MRIANLKKVFAIGLTGISVLYSTMVLSGVAVVVHPSNTNTLTTEDISRIFLGKKRSFPDGQDAIPIDIKEGSEQHSNFVQSVLKKNEQQIKSYWAQQLFTGKGTPPKSVSSSTEVKKLVADNPAIIGYIDSTEVDDTVRVVKEY